MPNPTNTPMKLKTCKACKQKFTPAKPLQYVCDWNCAALYTTQLAEKRKRQDEANKRKEYREAKEKQKTRADWMREAQQAFNAYIRARDDKEPCISCGRHHSGQYHAGHYRTTAAAPELRFNELNVWKQCAPCNNHKHGNITEYRINLVKRIGIELVEYLEGAHQPKKYTIDDLKEIKRIYKEKLKEIQKCH